MEHYIGIDVSLELSSLCVLDASGKVIREVKVASEPKALVAFLRGLGVAITRVGLEAGPCRLPPALWRASIRAPSNAGGRTIVWHAATGGRTRSDRPRRMP
jgi:hypothetical protein